MTIEEARALIQGVEWRGSRPGLSRVRELLHRIGDPQDTLQFVHIAGTNGKGSTAAMLAAVLQAAGYTTGLFTSPFLEQFAERMQVNGQPIPDAELAAACETLQPCIAAMDDQPTEFELVTAAAMLWFQRRGCDVVVLGASTARPTFCRIRRSTKSSRSQRQTIRSITTRKRAKSN